MKTIQVQDLFEVHKGKSYFKDFTEDSEGFNYITTSGINQGVKTRVGRNPNYRIFPKGTITVALQGSVMSAFVQRDDFYIQTHVAALIEKQPLTIRQKLYYCLCFSANATRFSFGRKANTTFTSLEIPAPEEIPAWVETIELPQQYTGEAKSDEKVELPPVSEWKEFKYTDLFDLEKGRGPSAAEAKHKPGNIPYIGASAKNNGITLYSEHTPEHQGNVITIATDGSVGEAFYQAHAFNATSNIMVLHLKNYKCNPQIGLFISTIIRQEQSKFNYGRKWGLSRMKESFIALPATPEGQPDYDLMERYINSLPYSANL